MNKIENHIRVEDCKPNYIYKLHSRNLSYGVFHLLDTPDSFPYKRGFTGIRQKFNMRFLDTEYHWDDGAPYGTVKPIEEVGPSPVFFPDNTQRSQYSKSLTDEERKLIFEHLDKLDNGEK